MVATNIHRYSMPGVTLFGWGCIQKLGEELENFQVGKCLLVTDKFMVNSGVVSQIIEILRTKGIKAAVFSEVKPNPDLEQVTSGVEQYLAGECQALISLGGGSSHDCAKGIKLTLLHGKLAETAVIPLVCITTTAGTGSEVTRFAVLTNPTRHVKMVLTDDAIMPNIAVDDPSLMTGMPPELTAATGMDALTHAVEAYVALGRSPFTECMALKALQLIDRFLVRAFLQGGDCEAREGMTYAQYLAGISFSNAGLGVGHAVAHSLGGVYNIPHGVACAVMLPYSIAFNLEAAASFYAEIAWAIKAADFFLPEKQAVRLLIKYLLDLNRKLSLPGNLHQLNVDPNDFNRLAEISFNDNTLGSNPVNVSLPQLKKIFEAAYEGNLSC